MKVDKWCSVVGENALEDAKPTNHIVLDKIGHNSSIGSLDCLDPLYVAFGGNKDPYITSRWWINRADEIESLGLKWS